MIIACGCCLRYTPYPRGITQNYDYGTTNKKLLSIIFYQWCDKTIDESAMEDKSDMLFEGILD